MDDENLTGSQKAAILLMAMGESRSNRLKLEMDKDEVEELRDAQVSLGRIPSGVVENILEEYDSKSSALPMNQPQNRDLKLQQELEHAKAEAQKRAARRTRQKPVTQTPPKRPEAKPDGEGVSTPVQHLTNIEV